MTKKCVPIIALFIAISFTATVYFADAEQQHNKEVYEKIDRSELAFEFEAKFSGVEYDGTAYKTVGGVVTKFLLSGKSIPLESDKITEDSFILTKDFGKVKLTYNSRLQASIWLTSSQKKAFKKFTLSK